MQSHAKIDFTAAREGIAQDLETWAGSDDFVIESVTPFETIYSATPEDVAEIEIRYARGRAIYGVTADGRVNLYAN